ncbi:hypothetical protein NTHI1209_00722 [Haemophilus influenzae]|uniref:Uncharacterized protein n=1 Tax=Haemophilus influenzae TaxID=727 RepID=A0A158SW75_HAEIF|nr:hypothetical protein NTHI1209_00722 [Haemophilus influenzae]
MDKIYFKLVFLIPQIKKRHLSLPTLFLTIQPYLMIGNSLLVNEFQT